jgi:hypothetical protein
MAMSPKCIQAVQAAANGKPVSAAKLAQIEDAINNKMTELARRDPAKWHGLTRDQRMTEAATAAMQDVQAQAARKEHLANLQVLKAVETDTRIQTLKAENAKLTRSQSQIKDLFNTENYAAGVYKEATKNLRDMINASETRDGTGVMRGLGMRLLGLDNPAMTADVVREVYAKADGHTGNKAAQAGAKAWLDTIEGLRTRFNAAGGDIGKLGYGYLSQAHDLAKVVATKADVWAKFIMDNQLLDRKQYVHPDGALLNDAEITAMLMASHETLATGGANKNEPGQAMGTGARSNRGSDSRVIHFKDGDAWIKYMGEYGEGSLYDSMIGHISRMSRDIALVERMGPNPEATFKVQADISKRADNPHNTTFKEVMDSRSMGATPEAIWRIVSGEKGTPESRFIARNFQDARNIMTASKIVWGPLTGLADVATSLQTLHYHRIPAIEYLSAYKDQIKGILKPLTKNEHVEFLKTQEVISESLLSSMERHSGQHMTHSLFGKVTNAVMKLTLMNAWTDAARNAFSDVLMRSYTNKLGKSWQQLDEWDRYLMGNKGITETDWAIITKATPDPLSPVALVSAPRIRATGLEGAQEAATKWSGFVSDEAQFAVVNPDLASRNITTGKPGTPHGEVWTSVMQFKAYPMAMFTRHYGRIFNTPQGLEGAPVGFRGESTAGVVYNRAAALAGLTFAATIMGAIQTEARQMAVGKDPITADPTDEKGRKFWAKAFAAGGGGTYMADVLMAAGEDPSRKMQGHLGLLGPLAGVAGGVVDVAKSKHPGADAVKLVSDQLPGMWQFRAAYEHWFLHNAQEALNPGYLARMRARAQKDWGQDYWWSPGEMTPDRAPDLSKIGAR